MKTIKKCIAITLSPTPKHINRLKQHDLCTPALYKILRHFTNYYGRPELTLSGLIHYHVYLVLETEQQMKHWMTRSINSLRQLGNTKIKVITEGTDDKWIAYIDKEKEIYDEIFINRNNNICPENCPTYKEIKLSVDNGVLLDLEEGLDTLHDTIKIKYHKTIKKCKYQTTINAHIKTKKLKLKPIAKLTEDEG